MYPTDDTVIQLRLATRRARALRERVREQLVRARALCEHTPPASAQAPPSRQALLRDVRETRETSRRLIVDAHEQLRQTRMLVADMRRQTAARAAKPGA